MPWIRSRLLEKCPLHDVVIGSSGGKYFAYPRPCVKGEWGDKDKEVCPYLSQHFSGRYNTSVQCRYKPLVSVSSKCLRNDVE